MKRVLRSFILLCLPFSAGLLQAQNVGIGQAIPVNKLDVNGALSVGTAYSGVSSAPANGAIIQGNTGIGIAAPAHRLHVVGDVRIEGNFINQEITGVHLSAVQNVPFTNAVFNPITGLTASINCPDGNGVNNSGVLITIGIRVFGGSLNGASSSMGGYFFLLQRDTDPGFSAPVNLTYTSGDCFIKTPNGLGSAAIGYGDGAHLSYVDLNLTAGVTYYYRGVLYPNGVSITSGTYDIYERDLNIVQIKR